MRLWMDLIFLLFFCICQNLYNNYLLISESKEIHVFKTGNKKINSLSSGSKVELQQKS